jgi:predicted alpha/beta superfamily hydrolase
MCWIPARLLRRWSIPCEIKGATGGNDAFLSFIIDELKPAIAKATQVDPGRQALFGHSLGGLFVLHALFSRSDAFDTFIAGSPSIWWGKKSPTLRETLPAARASRCRVGSNDSVMHR